LATAFEVAEDPPAPITGQLLVNAFDLLSQFLVGRLTASTIGRIGFVVIAAGGNSGYLAGFRN
jgi:hypothetical protein